MSKFHKEFFKQGGTEHDELILRVTSNLRRIIKRTDLPNYIKKSVKTRERRFRDIEKNPKIWVCNCKDIKFCSKDCNVGWNKERFCTKIEKDYRDKLVFRDKCKYFVSDKYNKQEEEVLKKGEWKKGRLLKRDVFQVDDYHTEVLCKSGDFIVGYADLVAYLSFKRFYHLKIEDSTWTNFYDKIIEDKKVIIEVKPKVKDFGAILRQIKTYMDTLKDNPYGMIVTYSDISNEMRELLKKEGVFVVSLDKKETPENDLDKYKK